MAGAGVAVMLAACGRATDETVPANPSPGLAATPVPTPTVVIEAAPTAVKVAPSAAPTRASPSPTSSLVLPTASPVPLAAAPSATSLPTAQSLATAVPPTNAPALPTQPRVQAPSAAASNLPRRLRVPRLRIDAVVEHVGLAPDGSMDVPKRYDTVGWYKLGSRPGDAGSAVMAGHLDSKTGPAIFWKLGDLRPGDELSIVNDDGAERRFAVEASERYRFDAAPLERIFAATDRARLNLITCSGTFDRGSQNYDLRLVVYSTLIE